MKWRESRNKDDTLAGQRAITGLFDTVNLGLSNSASKIDETMPSALQFFMDKFRVIMKDTERSTAKDISLAILGYGQFSKLLARYNILFIHGGVYSVRDPRLKGGGGG